MSFVYLDMMYLFTWLMNWQNIKKKKKKSKSKLATLVKGDPKAPFSIATTSRCKGGRYSIPGIAPLYSWSLPWSDEC